MSQDLRDLYQEVVIDHGNQPRNFRPIDDATQTAEGVNPLCGDQMTLYLRLSGDIIEDIAFQGTGCAISKASASLMTTVLKGKTRQEALAWFERVHALLTQGPSSVENPDDLGKLAVLSGLWEFPMRIKCATLAWYTLRSALKSPIHEEEPQQ